MLANKENVVLHAPQAGRAHPKTPAPGKMATKTPFKIPLNDENTTALPKTGKKTLFAGRDPSQFVTPAGPRRQALAGKTTNVKARGLAPSVQQGKIEKKQDNAVKPQRTQLVISEQAEAAVHETDEVPEIEYMAPVPPELPFVPEGIEEEPDYEWMKKNYMKGCFRTYLADVDEDGKSELQRRMEENFRMLEAELDAESEEAICNAKGIRKPKATITKASVPARDTKTRRAEEKKASEAKRSTSRSRQPSNARPTPSRPTSAASVTRPTSSSASITRPTSSSQRRAASTLDSRKAAEALSQRPTSSASNTHPESRLARHSRSGSTTVEAPKRPLSFSRSHSRSGSVPSAVVTKSTVGYTAGREVRDNVKKTVSKAKLESALDAIERIQREDEEADAAMPLILIPEDDEDDVVVELPSPLIEDEEEFFMTMPELE
ncbi:hypothetical protein K440DRAFT_657829 [Wilcoxina mikolae CBS 423.85]|nr:hypothetical protein K440DRAFT_657829 [Wilcoxina mikolae CBS 423.85]